MAKPSVHQQTAYNILRESVTTNDLIYQELYTYSNDTGLYGIYNIQSTIYPYTKLFTQYDNIGGIQSQVKGTLTFSWDTTYVSYRYLKNNCIGQGGNVGPCGQLLTMALTSQSGESYISPVITSTIFVPTISRAVFQAGSFTIDLSVGQVFYVYYDMIPHTVQTLNARGMGGGINFKVLLN